MSDALKKMVRCTYCNGTYNLFAVEVTARYSDCSMWKAPCCGRLVDDRGETGWKSIKDYHVIRDDEGDIHFDTPYGPVYKRRWL